MENLDHGKFFDLLYEGEDDIVKLDVLEMVASVRQTYPLLLLLSRLLHCVSKNGARILGLYLSHNSDNVDQF